MSKATVDRPYRNNEPQEPVYELMENVTEQQDKETPASRFAPSTRLCLWVLGLLMAGCAVAIRVRPMDSIVRALVAATLLFAVFTLLLQVVRHIQTHPKGLYPVVFFIGLGLLWGAMASKPLSNDPRRIESLQHRYTKELMSFMNEPYAWGGETHSGIDCSGLARAAMWQAMLKEGVRAFNPYLLGSRLWSFWWTDMTAQDMLNQRHGYTIKLGTADKLAGYDNSGLNRGDLAIAGNGSHVLVYMGDGQWIEANPDDGKVVLNKATADSKRPYFNSPVTFMRWSILKSE